MNTEYKTFMSTIMQDSAYNCPICGAPRYVTDQINHELTLHCSSTDARFWDLPRGSEKENAARQHWDLSRKDIFLSVEDVLRYLAEEQNTSKDVIISKKPDHLID